MVVPREDLYALLQVAPDASQDEIGAAYARLRELYSAERLQSGPSEFQELAARRREELQTAYVVLNDPQRRAEYDARHRPASVAAPLDYRPLPPANRRERPSPSIPLPAVGGSTRDRVRRGRRSLVTPLMVSGTVLAVLLVVVLTNIHTSSGPGALATPPIPNLQLPYDAGQLRDAGARAKQANDAQAWATYGDMLYDNMEQMRERAPTAPQYLGQLPQWLDATQAYSRALELGAGPATRADLALTLFYYGVGSNDKAYTERSVVEAQRALKAGPDDPRVLLNYGLILAGLNPPRETDALVAWRHLISVAPQSPEAGRARDLVAVYGS